MIAERAPCSEARGGRPFSNEAVDCVSQDVNADLRDGRTRGQGWNLICYAMDGEAGSCAPDPRGVVALSRQSQRRLVCASAVDIERIYCGPAPSVRSYAAGQRIRLLRRQTEVRAHVQTSSPSPSPSGRRHVPRSERWDPAQPT
ncbi:hypothetical protein CALVIDRAFT_290342 [Calocera viscosa TUFC12733]|uniref:Uncharacterized protein n=1 Tax=Calocera viscosa (strain TUFC12733) TaxID=1330018 RepID=A0A167IRA1_CALVF|nr:hypothetical protein CALVIDRAFT_290342 [Calocera viscosa TUFC12733]